MPELTNDGRLLTMKAAVEKATGKPVIFEYDAAIASKAHGSQTEFDDALLVRYAKLDEEGTYIIAHELGHAMRNSRPGSLQLQRAMLGAFGRSEAVTIASILEHPSVVALVRANGFEPDAIFERRGNAAIKSRMADTFFMQGQRTMNDFGDTAALAEALNAYLGAVTAQFIDLYKRVRPDLLSKAESVAGVINSYTSGECGAIEAAQQCARIMDVPFTVEHFTVRDEAWCEALRRSPRWSETTR